MTTTHRPVEVRWEGLACQCCADVIANGDESACRDYYGHTHETATLPARVLRQLNETYPELAATIWTAYLVIASYSEDREVAAGCDLCDASGYLNAYAVAVVR